MKKGKVENRPPTIDEKLGDTLLERHLLFQEVKNWVIEAAQFAINKRVPKVYNIRRLLDRNRNPLMGIEYFKHCPDIKSPLSVVLGVYLGGHLDNEYWREQAEDWFRKQHGIDFTMHRGLCTAGNQTAACRLLSVEITMTDDGIQSLTRTIGVFLAMFLSLPLGGWTAETTDEHELARALGPVQRVPKGQETDPCLFAHPHYWAGFVLTGDPG